MLVEKYVILGDFNACLGSRVNDEQWTDVRGPHGLGVVNDVGRALSFLASHQATVCNTWFKKRDIYKRTRQHPKFKQWSSINFVVTRQRDRGMYVCGCGCQARSCVQH